MTKKEKLDKVSNDFSSLCEEQQDYVLGILQALVFAKNEINAGQGDSITRRVKERIQNDVVERA
ncbi:hypothetical protein FACS1894163_11990 [Spirochaetia bacterium]|nr:hypothetical protein FACS1894163_11990 [Spirochaetia bacterium]